MNVNIKNIVWETQEQDLPKTLDLELDGDYIEELVSNGVDKDEAVETVIYEDVESMFKETLIEFEWAEIEE